jgi:transcriptional regulator GlxA family with amidase domain
MPRLHFVSTASALRGAIANDVHAPDWYVQRALAAMRADPARRWTVAALARVAGLSRAPFARRFHRSTGTSPLRWLTEHRLGLAQSRLVQTDLGLAAIAVEIGYGSDFAFAKAFKRTFGVAPGGFRRLASRDAGAASIICAAA